MAAAPFLWRHQDPVAPDRAETRKTRIVGPMVGEVGASGACLWVRADRAGPLALRLQRAGSAERILMAEADEANDLCVQWDVDGLIPGTDYHYAVEREGVVVAGGDHQHFRTAPEPDTKACTSLVFGSCADGSSAPAWTRMKTVGCDLLVLLGDTPYLKGKKLKRFREGHREFLAEPALASLLHQTPMVATFDDNDCGGMDADDETRAAARKAFVEYRAMRRFGDGEEGIYHSLRSGPVELFLIDTRSFAGRGPSPVDPLRRTLLGTRQWQWLTHGLKASNAPFKVLASGRIWNEKRPGGGDDWTEYRHERDALFRFIGLERIAGCVLVGGDIHVSRALRHRTRHLSGYDLHQFIASPLHDQVNMRRNLPDPELLHGVAVPHTFIQMVCDTTTSPARLMATCFNAAGHRLFTVDLQEQDLRP